MRRAVLDAARSFRVEKTHAPAPGPGEALVEVRAVGVCGSDLHLYKEGVIGGIPIEPGTTLGHECMGVVQAVGPETDTALVGRRVFVEPAIPCNHCRFCLSDKHNVCPHGRFLGLPPQGGALAERIVHPVALLEPLPDEVDDLAAVLLEPLAIAFHTLDRLGAPSAPTVILGAGPIGLVHTLLFARRGVSPLIVTDPLAYRRELALELGATDVADPRHDDVAGIVGDLTHGEGADVVIECAGEEATFKQMIEIASPAARVAVVGIPVEDRLSFRHSIARRKGLDVLMIRRSNHTFARALEWTVAERVALRDLATHEWPLAEVAAAFETASGYQDGVVKAVVHPTE